MSGGGFAVGGAVVVIGGIASILAGTPGAAHDLAPLTGPADVVTRFGQVAPLLAAFAAAVVAVPIAGLIALRRLPPVAAALELLVLGLVIEVCIGGASGRVGHSTDGGVLYSTVACVMGGIAVIAGSIISMLGRD